MFFNEGKGDFGKLRRFANDFEDMVYLSEGFQNYLYFETWEGHLLKLNIIFLFCKNCDLSMRALANLQKCQPTSCNPSHWSEGLKWRAVKISTKRECSFCREEIFS
jgi:hypothetical protein